MHANALQVSKCLMYTVSVHNINMAMLINILYQETAVSALYIIIMNVPNFGNSELSH